MRPNVLSAGLALAGLLAAGAARADGPEDAEVDPAVARERRLPPDRPLATKPGYQQYFVSVMGGTGLRFNNPYRLSTPLGGDAESVSRTNAYVDLGLAATFGNPLGFQHGAALRTTFGVEGVSQIVLTPSWFGWWRRGRWAAFGRAGTPIVATPDTTWGLEGSVGGALFVLGGLGVVAEVVGDVFFGTGTRDTSIATYPILSGQLGLLGTYEVLP